MVMWFTPPERRRQQELEKRRQEARAFSRRFNTDPHFRERYKEELRRQGREAADRDERTAAYHELASLIETPDVLGGRFLRLGQPPESGLSDKAATFEEAAREGGLSVFGGHLMSSGHYVLDVGNVNLRLQVLRLFGVEDRDAFLVRGSKVGVGSDGEPLVGQIREMVPLPKQAIVAAYPSMVSLEAWNERRGGPLVDRVPGLSAGEDD
jgi:hypothetical protein